MDLTLRLERQDKDSDDPSGGVLANFKQRVITTNHAKMAGCTLRAVAAMIECEMDDIRQKTSPDETAQTAPTIVEEEEAESLKRKSQ